MALTEKLASYIALEMKKNAQSCTANEIKNKNSEVLGLYSALMLWKSMVGNRRPWDQHKLNITINIILLAVRNRRSDLQTRQMK